MENEESNEEEFEVLVLESDEGEEEEVVVLERIEHDGSTYVLMTNLEDMMNMQKMNEEEYREFYGEQDESVFFIMRQTGEEYEELNQEEFEVIREDIQKHLQQQHDQD